MPAQNTLLYLVFLISTSITNVLRKFHPRVSPANLNTPSKGKRSVVVFAVLKIDKFNSVEKKIVSMVVPGSQTSNRISSKAKKYLQKTESPFNGLD